ncbi:hypothetical protein AVEN_126805-1 [Araneus ventricosus]|uniref:Uncharacterized protein n=1 Tax=Araneus ventricosus TaxID=182803 RepID=A0A4Y2RIG1_ARAVE|nr:hypothetical protein AVEN_126805-1 [Araneus ventricosus]
MTWSNLKGRYIMRKRRLSALSKSFLAFQSGLSLICIVEQEQRSHECHVKLMNVRSPVFLTTKNEFVFVEVEETALLFLKLNSSRGKQKS